ncbi:MAG TPA: glycosyltransferase family 1 protein, partial [Bacteroidia bacterium]|nr:glycosyltransferase family 1 protein [Bacteroidia bacterium]
VNAEIVDHDVNGCVCRNLDEWKSSLERLLSDPVFLRRLSQKTRDKVVSRYSVQSNRDNFLRLFLKDR